MSFEQVWNELRRRAESLDAGTVLVTPASERAFIVDDIGEDRIDIRFREPDEERTLWRDQFAVLDDQLAGDPDGLSLSDLPAGVRPYVTVLSLTPSYAVDESAGTLRTVDRDAATDDLATNPFVRAEWEVRTPRERVHDDALLLVELLERHSLDDLSARSADALVDVYVLLSDVQRGANRLRRRVGDALLDRIGPDDRLHGQFGTVRRTRRERRRLKDQDTVFDAVDERGIPRDWIIGVDRDKLDVVLAVTDLEASEVYDIDDQVYVQKIGVEEEAKHSRLQGLAERLDSLGSDEAEELQREIDQLETRLEDLLAAG